MSFSRTKFVNLAVIAFAATVISACQDAVAPITSPASVPATRAFSVESRASRDLIKDQYIVVLRDGVDVDAQAKRLIGKTKGKVNKSFKKGLKGFGAQLTQEDAAVVANDPNVEYVEQDQVLMAGVGKPAPAPTTTTAPSKGGKTTAPAPLPAGTSVQAITTQWGLDRVDQAALPFGYTYTYTATGTGVNVYVLDAGIRISHSDFGGRATADFSTIADGYGAIGCNWHGTHVAAIVGGKSSGVAKGVNLHSVRILDCNASGSVSDAIAGIDWVIANRVMPAIINLSVAGGDSPALRDAVNRAIASGITVVAAAGNNADDACKYSPANTPDAITVGATEPRDQLSFISNFGSCLDLLAPGESIMSASYTDDTSFQYGSGTSMASPFVVGVAATYLQQNPLATPAAVRAAIVARATVGKVTLLPAGTVNLLLRAF